MAAPLWVVREKMRNRAREISVGVLASFPANGLKGKKLLRQNSRTASTFGFSIERNLIYGFNEVVCIGVLANPPVQMTRGGGLRGLRVQGPSATVSKKKKAALIWEPPFTESTQCRQGLSCAAPHWPQNWGESWHWQNTLKLSWVSEFPLRHDLQIQDNRKGGNRLYWRLTAKEMLWLLLYLLFSFD